MSDSIKKVHSSLSSNQKKKYSLHLIVNDTLVVKMLKIQGAVSCKTKIPSNLVLSRLVSTGKSKFCFTFDSKGKRLSSLF